MFHLIASLAAQAFLFRFLPRAPWGFFCGPLEYLVYRDDRNGKLTLLSGQGHEMRWIYHSDRFDIINWMLAQ